MHQSPITIDGDLAVVTFNRFDLAQYDAETAYECGKRGTLEPQTTEPMGVGSTHRLLTDQPALPGRRLTVECTPHHLPRDLTGQRFGRLVVRAACGTAGGHRLWVCTCDCGNEAVVRSGNLRSGNTKSCGCLQVHTRVESNIRHGMYGTPVYNRWRQMIQRCTNPKNHAWADYGGRGIRFCDAWWSFDAFYRDMGDPPSGTTLDRIDSDGDYCPENCRWALPQRQARNRRNTLLITLNGRTQPLADWADEYGIAYQLAYYRIRRGWDVEPALSEPARRQGASS